MSLTEKEIATKGFMVVSCNVRCGEEHTKSWTILSYGKSSEMTLKTRWLPTEKRQTSD